MTHLNSNYKNADNTFATCCQCSQTIINIFWFFLFSCKYTINWYDNYMVLRFYTLPP